MQYIGFCMAAGVSIFKNVVHLKLHEQSKDGSRKLEKNKKPVCDWLYAEGSLLIQEWLPLFQSIDCLRNVLYLSRISSGIEIRFSTGLSVPGEQQLSTEKVVTSANQKKLISSLGVFEPNIVASFKSVKIKVCDESKAHYDMHFKEEMKTLQFNIRHELSSSGIHSRKAINLESLTDDVRFAFIAHDTLDEINGIPLAVLYSTHNRRQTVIVPCVTGELIIRSDDHNKIIFDSSGLSLKYLILMIRTHKKVKESDKCGFQILRMKACPIKFDSKYAMNYMFGTKARFSPTKFSKDFTLQNFFQNSNFNREPSDSASCQYTPAFKIVEEQVFCLGDATVNTHCIPLQAEYHGQKIDFREIFVNILTLQNIPTLRLKDFNSLDEAINYIGQWPIKKSTQGEESTYVVD